MMLGSDAKNSDNPTPRDSAALLAQFIRICGKRQTAKGFVLLGELSGLGIRYLCECIAKSAGGRDAR